MQDLEESTIADHFAAPVVIPVVPRNSSFPRDSVPRYVTEKVPLASLISDAYPPSDDLCLKMLDFGRGKATFSSSSNNSAGLLTYLCIISLIDKRPERDLPGAAPLRSGLPKFMCVCFQLAAGEIESACRKEADIWAVGCIVSVVAEKPYQTAVDF